MIDNKLNINNITDLVREEERISKKKAVMLFDKQILQNIKCGEFSTLQAIHKYLFEDIYDFAGKLRNVNIAKGNFCFAPIIYKEMEQDPKSILPTAMIIICGLSNAAYQREDGIYVVPLTALKD